MNFKVFLINLDRSTERLEISQKLLREQGIPYERISAVDGQTLGAGQIKDIYQFDDFQTYYKKLNAGEVGCYLSHRKVWQRIIDDNLDFAVILEDDFAQCSSLKSAIALIAKLPRAWDYIKLAEHSRKRRFISQRNFEQICIGIYDKIPARTLAQAVSMRGAQKLLAQSKQIKRPVDIDIQYWWEKDILALGISPAVVTPRENEVSQIDLSADRNSADKSRLKQISHAIRFKIDNKRFQNRQKEEFENFLELVEAHKNDLKK
ncbi:glycosyltransferase family 25 protein [Aliikangiella sp. G2MR2-5]|uniref:glycosyltransferase family 25 protein n=1 Tax=Aliikangiella sp. G2MR2-5 TaxID=2788943 RepID=UPI0018AC7C04|nr:glycosyltransferase family 25 protein [Aliikangiella sp. G2MR2-5]